MVFGRPGGGDGNSTIKKNKLARRWWAWGGKRRNATRGILDDCGKRVEKAKCKT